jgi:uncharacterized protein YndB with AHSA1/START domain
MVGSSGLTTPAIELDLRVGGRYRFAMQPPEGDLFHLTGEFREVDPPSRLVYTFVWEAPGPRCPGDGRHAVISPRGWIDPGELQARRVCYRGTAGAARARLDGVVRAAAGTGVGALTGRHLDRDALKGIRGLGRRPSLSVESCRRPPRDHDETVGQEVADDQRDDPGRIRVAPIPSDPTSRS